jgi:hypothetical protein
MVSSIVAVVYVKTSDEIDEIHDKVLHLHFLNIVFILTDIFSFCVDLRTLTKARSVATKQIIIFFTAALKVSFLYQFLQ